RSRYCADCEENRGALGPTLCEREIDLVLAAQPLPLSNDHQERHCNPDRRKDDVKSERHRHLRSRRQQIVHSNYIISLLLQSTNKHKEESPQKGTKVTKAANE